MTNVQNDPYAIVIADLERKRDEISTLIESLKAIRGMQAHSQNTTNLVDLFVQPRPYSHMSMADAAKDVLAKNGRPMGNADILAALEDGGLESQSQQPLNTLGSILNRRANDIGDIVRVGRGTWALKEWIDFLRANEIAADHLGEDHADISGE